MSERDTLVDEARKLADFLQNNADYKPADVLYRTADEIEKLTAELEACRNSPRDFQLTRLREQYEARIADAERDALRYRWLRDADNWFEIQPMLDIPLQFEELDIRIDECMADAALQERGG